MNSGTKLNTFSLSMVVIGLVIGMGIFRTSSVVANASIHPNIFFAAWIFGGLIALSGALTFAEIGARFPVTGAYYRIFSVAYSPSIAFAMNGLILVSNAASLGGVAIIGSEYFCEFFFPEDPADVFKSGLASLFIFIFYLINLGGLRMSSSTLNLLMLIKIGMLLLIIAALFLPETHFSDPAANIPNEPLSVHWIWSFGAALTAVCFTYGGYQQTINFGEEIEKPSQTIPRSIFIGIFCIIVLYLLANFAYYKVIGFEALKHTNGIATAVAMKLLGPAGQTLFSLLLVLAVMAFVNVNLMSNPRVMFAMSQDGVLPASFGKRFGKNEVLGISLTAFASCSMVITFFAETFDRILGFVMIFDSIGMAAAAASLFYFRNKAKRSEENVVYAMRWFPWIPLFFIATYLFVAGSAIYSYPMYGLTAIIAFLCLYASFKLISRKTTDSTIS